MLLDIVITLIFLNIVASQIKEGAGVPVLLHKMYFKELKKLDQDYQQQQALVAIYNGGFSGVGPGKSTQRNILPYSSSDFIFAIMVEE